MSSRSQEREHSTSVVFLEESNEACALLLVLIPLALSTAVMRFGPYLDLSSRLAPDKPLDEAPVASTTEAAVLFERLGEKGRLLYRRHSWWDVRVVVAHAATLTTVLSVALPRASAPRRLSMALLLLPVGAALADFAENVAIAQLVAPWQAPPASWVTFARIATTAKMFAMGTAAVSVIASYSVCGLRVAYKAVRPQSVQGL